MLPACNGVMTVHRDYMGDTPCGMKFTTLAGVMGGGASSPGFVGHSKFNITQGKFIKGRRRAQAPGLDAQEPQGGDPGAAHQARQGARRIRTWSI
jgi:hypothetical protein